MTYKYIENPDAQLVKEIKEAIGANDGYCCCATVKTPETKCMCKEFRDSTKGGQCHCGRFVKIPVYPTLVILGNIGDKDLCSYYCDTLLVRGLNVLLAPNLSINNSTAEILHFDELCEMTKDMIYHNEGVFVVSDKDKFDEYTESMVEWAQLLNKKIIYLGDEL